MKSILFAFLCFTLSTASLSALADNNDAFSKANEYYKTGVYDSAITIYENILSQGVVSSELYFNLGNSYYKKGMLADAIINYERARRLNPADDDIKHNLALANSNTVDRIVPLPKVFYEEWFENFLHGSRVSQKAVLAILLVWMALFLWLLYLFVGNTSIRKLGFFSGLLSLIIGTVLLIISVLQNRQLERIDEAIVYDTSAYVKSSPEKSGSNLFLLHEGARLRVIDELEGWKKIRIANGNVGWISANAIVII